MQKTRLASHIGLVDYNDDDGSHCVDVYLRSNDRLFLQDPKQRERLKELLDSFNNFAYSVRPDRFVYFYFVDGSKYTPKKLEEALRGIAEKPGFNLIAFQKITDLVV